jgi:hypothetical protein
VRPDLCEQVWAEAINVQGKSLVNTYNYLKEAGLTENAEELQRMMNNKNAWRKYTQQLFINFQNDLKKSKPASQIKIPSICHR